MSLQIATVKGNADCKVTTQLDVKVSD